MTIHYELSDIIPGNIFQLKIFCDFSLCLCLQMCLNMADPIQLSGVDGSYVDNKIVSFTHLNWD
jgi:hypothetical protein